MATQANAALVTITMSRCLVRDHSRAFLLMRRRRPWFRGNKNVAACIVVGKRRQGEVAVDANVTHVFHAPGAMATLFRVVEPAQTAAETPDAAELWACSAL